VITDRIASTWFPRRPAFVPAGTVPPDPEPIPRPDPVPPSGRAGRVPSWVPGAMANGLADQLSTRTTAASGSLTRKLKLSSK
jgi:hypothetical protein